MNTITSTRTRRLTAFLPVAALAITAFVGPASPAGATDTAVGYRIDQDYVSVVSPDGTSKVTADRILAFFNWDYMRIQVHGTVHRNATAAGCRSAKVTFVFADETQETTKESPRACKQYGVTDKVIDFHPTKEKDVVRYHVYLLTSTDLTSPATTLKYATGFVGDAPESYGTATRLDTDPMELVDNGQKIFTEGVSDWWIQREDIAGITFRFARGRVQGTLTRPTSLAGEMAWLQVTWHYADRSSVKKLSGAVTKAAPTRHVDMTSDKYKEAMFVEIKVITDWPTSSALTQAHFGDWSGK